MITAEQLLEQLLTYHMNYGEKVELIQQAMDQAQIEGARKMQAAAADEVDSNIGSRVTTGIRCATFIRALSPETVCKGE